MPRTPLAVHLILLLGQVCFASLPVAGRLALQGGTIPPAGIVIVRMVGAAIVFALIAWRRGTLRVDREDVWKLVGCSILGVAANQELFIQGLAHSTATNASVLGATIPVFTLVVAMFLGRERAHAYRVVGIAVAFTGAALLVGIDRVSTSSDHVLGSVLILLNSVVYAIFLVVVRPLSNKYDPIGLLALLFLIGIPMAAPFGIVAWLDAPPISGSDVAFLAFLIAVPTVGGYGLVQVALRRAESTLVAAYIYLQPVFTSIGAVLLLNEDLTLRMAGCGLIVLSGVWLAARRASTPARA